MTKEIKVGSFVRALTDTYQFTSKKLDWVGEVTSCEDDTFTARTVSFNGEARASAPGLSAIFEVSSAISVGDIFSELRYRDFEVIDPPSEITHFTHLVLYTTLDGGPETARVVKCETIRQVEGTIKRIATKCGDNLKDIEVVRVAKRHPIMVQQVFTGIPKA